MSSEGLWPRRTLQQVGVSLIDCDHRTPPAAKEGYPYVAIPQLKDGHIDLAGVRRISAADYAEWTRKLKPRAHDVIVVRRCNSGYSALVPPGLDCAIGQNLVVLRADGKFIEPKFLRWLVRGPDWWEQVSKFINVGAVFDSLRCRDIPTFELTVPPRADQIAIAGILDALDDRIALLRETNATLEAIAQALFKSWFVDFDPVRAKQQGTAPAGMDEATAALFPDGFEDSAFGPMPLGWLPCTMADVSTVGIGKTPPRKEARWFSDQPSDVRWASIRDMGAVGAFALNTSEYLTHEAIERFKVRVVPDNTVLLSFKMTMGRVAITDGAMTTNEAIAHFKLEASSLVTTEFLYLTLKRFDFSRLSSTSSIVDAVNSKTVRDLPLVVPDRHVAQAFQSAVEPLFLRMKVLGRQAQTLATLRDTLLPRLISGQLRLPEAEALMEETA